MASLANKYRPSEFSDVSSQSSLIKILERQIETNTFKNCIIMAGPSGCGKTTLARIFANKINKGLGEPIEVDAASNNGVDNVRVIIDSAIERSLDSKYKVFIIDEAHMITTAGWNAFLKCVEEPPEFTVFIFCTTDPQKIPFTIQNRCQIFSLSRINNDDIVKRLEYICNCEAYRYTKEAIEYITKLSQGSMRQAISYLDKCKDLSSDITLENAIACLGNYSYDVMFNLTNYIIDGNKSEIINTIENLYQNGSDLKLFISNYLEFILQVYKYCLLGNLSVTTIPESMKNSVDYVVGIENPKDYFNYLTEKILGIKMAIKNDTDIKTTIEIMLINK